MAKLFLDANIYLDFYKKRNVASLLNPLVSQAPNVIVSKQVVDEVLRNRTNVANMLLKEDKKKLNLSISLPASLSNNAIAEIDTETNSRLSTLKTEFNSIKETLESIYELTFQHVSEGTDHISTQLNEIFQNAIEPNEEQLNAAIVRKRHGNPPGKHNDPIGDELSWEQLKAYSNENHEEIWLVSNDGDFVDKSPNGTVLPNSKLRIELLNEGLMPMRFFDNLSSALSAFQAEVDNTLSLPSAEELEAAHTAQIGTPIQECPNENHSVKIIENGRFDMYVCELCGKTLGVHLADFCND